MSRRSPDHPTLPLSISSAAGSPARTFHRPTPAAKGSTETAPGSGSQCETPSPDTGPVSSLSRTSHDWFGGAWTALSGTSCSSVTRWRGPDSAPRMWEPPTGESGCSSWPTPTAGDAKSSGSRASKGNAGNKAHEGTSLCDATERAPWTTLPASDWKGGNRKGQLGEQIPGRLNPRWVESLMGFEPGWTQPAGRPSAAPGNTTGKPPALLLPGLGREGPD